MSVRCGKTLTTDNRSSRNHRSEVLSTEMRRPGGCASDVLTKVSIVFWARIANSIVNMSKAASDGATAPVPPARQSQVRHEKRF